MTSAWPHGFVKKISVSFVFWCRETIRKIRHVIYKAFLGKDKGF